METYPYFLRLLIRNYLLGSLIAVFGIGGIFIFSTLELERDDMLYILATLTIALVFMFVCEFVAFRRHLRPITRAFATESPTLDELRTAYLQTHRFAYLTVKRIVGPHLLGFAIPGVCLTLLELHFGLVSFPYLFVWLAMGGCLLVGVMHAMVEFYLSSYSVGTVLSRLRTLALEFYAVDLSLEGQVVVTIRKKFTLSALLIGTFPLLLFAFASEVRLAQVVDTIVISEYWQWAGVILVIGIAFASLGAYLMSRAVQEPIHQLQNLMGSVQEGRFNVRAEDSYSDEFSNLVAGFNHMVRGLAARDDLNNQLLESYFRTKEQRMGTGQCNVKAYNRDLMALIEQERANPSFIISHELPLEKAAEGYANFDARKDGWTKVVLKTGA